MVITFVLLFHYQLYLFNLTNNEFCLNSFDYCGFKLVFLNLLISILLIIIYLFFLVKN
jgi:hypothetical protein